VVANSTLVPSNDGAKRAIVHFEVTIESFRRAFASETPDYEAFVVDRPTGRVVIDSSLAQRRDAPLGRPQDRRFTGLVGRPIPSGLVKLAGQQGVVREVGHRTGNANDWVVVVRATAPSSIATGGLALGGGLLLLAFVLVGFGALGLRAQRRELEDAATTDALTGLANRRRLVLDLDRLLERGPSPHTLMLFDLDGFKSYNDRFGHLAGDALLARLGAALHVAAGDGAAYRLGGDEFCVLSETAGATEVEVAALGALTERGEGFAVTASHGVVALPDEARDATEALRIADQRMYSAKSGGRDTAGRQSKDVLVRALAERHPDLGEHNDGVAALAADVAKRLGLTGEALDQVGKAAELHDIGKVAIPDDILDKPGPLDDDEWAFIRRHTIIGERIVSAAPSLAPVGRLIRASHERWDGKGYPDRLAGDGIPLGARVVAVCDAFDAMTSERPYSAARPVAAALDELERCAGAQFDPNIVALLVQAVRERATAAHA
jgi:diguanylate cyclase (GGDEF)-like protein